MVGKSNFRKCILNPTMWDLTSQDFWVQFALTGDSFPSLYFDIIMYAYTLSCGFEVCNRYLKYMRVIVKTHLYKIFWKF